MFNLFLKRRLVSFGCSYTFGHGLNDCHDEKNNCPNTPSKYAWPNILAKLLDAKTINQSVSGSSNKVIWNKIINFNFKENDIVCILWTHEDRSAIFHDSKQFYNIGSWDIEHNKISENYYKHLYAKYDSEMISSLFISHANYFLSEKNIQFYNLFLDKSQTQLLDITKTSISHVPVYFKSYITKYPLALDNRHPGIEAHTEFAKEIFKHVS